MKRHVIGLKVALLIMGLWGCAYPAAAYYDPGVQRWINRDRMGEHGGVDLFTAIHNGPINWIDGFGLATIQCDGNGNYEVVLGSYKGEPVEACVRQHEEDHIKDYKKRYGEDSCKGRKKGDLPGGDLPGEPPGTYENWLEDSECRAYKDELECLEKLLKTCPDKDWKDVDYNIRAAKDEIKRYCKDNKKSDKERKR